MPGEAIIVYNGERFPAKIGEDILGQLLIAQADIQYLCMGGSCGTCKVRMISGSEHLAPVAPGELHYLKNPGPERLACQAIIIGDGEIEIVQP